MLRTSLATVSHIITSLPLKNPSSSFTHFLSPTSHKSFRFRPQYPHCFIARPLFLSSALVKSPTSTDVDIDPLYLSCSMPNKRLKIAVLLSGGVDSSVALRLLHAAGHSCTAFYLKIWFQVWANIYSFSIIFIILTYYLS